MTPLEDLTYSSILLGVLHNRIQFSSIQHEILYFRSYIQEYIKTIYPFFTERSIRRDMRPASFHLQHSEGDNDDQNLQNIVLRFVVLQTDSLLYKQCIQEVETWL